MNRLGRPVLEAWQYGSRLLLLTLYFSSFRKRLDIGNERRAATLSSALLLLEIHPGQLLHAPEETSPEQ